MAKQSLRDRAINLAKKYLPSGFRHWIVTMQKRFHLQWPPAGTVRFGSLRRLTPISPVFALDRGFPIERYYIEKFLGDNSADVQGRCLEMGDDFYIRKFGGEKVSKTDVLSVVAGEGVTLIGDLTAAEHLPSDTFDCIIFTQSLQMIYDMRAALRTLYRILRPGGVLLLTSHGTSKIGRHLGRDDWGEYWHITSQAARALMAETFADADVTIGAYGNVLAAVSALHGLAAEELTPEELDYQDRDFEVIVTVRAMKPAGSS